MFDNSSLNVLIGMTGIFLTVFAAVWSLAWWLSSQFTAIRNLIYSELKALERNIFDKIEYHEKHDDTRFSAVDGRLSNIRDDIWDIRVRNSAKDTLMDDINGKLIKINSEATYNRGIKQGAKEANA